MKKLILLSIVSLSTLFSSAQCVADFTWSVSGSIVQFTNTSSGTTTYSWSLGDGAFTSLSNPTHTYTTGGMYDVCLVASYNDSMGGVCADTLCQQISVQDSTGGNGCTGNASIYANGMQIIGVNSSFGAFIFDWSVSDYNSGTSLTTQTTTNLNYAPGYSGDFWVCLTAYDSMGMVCDTICDIVTLSDSLDSTASTSNIDLLNFSVFPNPTNAALNIQFDHLPSKAHAHIVDLLGREMIEVDLTSQLTKVNVTDLPSGMYMIQLIDSSNQIIGMHKFLKE